ncbi:MAG: aminomethyl-transferring glycine dehydrogenase subunit GcvPB [Spirochaetes bacterium]|nr:aminomethyl-transferring glycine dehydrogenase subunit GcvPB [Spirochaetota bacterium]
MATKNQRIHTVEPFIWELSAPGRVGASIPEADVPEYPLPGEIPLRTDLPLPEVSELEVVRHFTRLSRLNFSIDTHMYPLGSCTMKYNPKVNDAAASLPGFSEVHPLLPEDLCQGSLELLYRLQRALETLSGFTAVSLQPAAGAHGELAGVLMIRAYHLDRGDTKRTRILIPDSAHGTNPASVSMAGFTAEQIPSDKRGNVDLSILRQRCDDTVAGLMITNPNTLGLFEENIEEVTGIVHEAGGLVYGDGANFNALLGYLRPADVGIDVMHFNLHKTFSTPHGGGGPGAGPVGANARLAPYLPGPIVRSIGSETIRSNGRKRTEGAFQGHGSRYTLFYPEKSIGRVKAFYGNFGILVRAFAYILQMGGDGLRAVAEHAVLNANYLKHLIGNRYRIPYSRPCMHEFVATGDIAPGIHTMDVAKRLLDYGFHPPTVYFPLIVKEALMIEPTETESRQTIEAFADALLRIAEEAATSPELLHEAPHDTPVGRLDEVRAAREPILNRRQTEKLEGTR